MDDNYLLNSNQSGFYPGDSSVHQLLAIRNNICKAFETNPSREVRGVFLSLSKVFDRVWYAGLMYKLKQLGICGKYSGLIHSFLNNQYQKVVLNEQSSYQSQVKAGVWQGSILGSLLFLICIKDFLKGLNSNVKLFADDSTLFLVACDPRGTAETLNDQSKVSQW